MSWSIRIGLVNMLPPRGPIRKQAISAARSIPWFESAPPAWICRRLHDLAGPYVIRQHGGEVRKCRPSDSIAGASMAFRTEILRQFRFDTRLGRVQGLLVGADDCDVVDRVRVAGYPGVWVGTARVRHFIPSERLTVAFVRRWFIGAGHTAVRQQLISADTSCVLGAPRWVVRRYLQEQLKSWLFTPLGGLRWFRAFSQAASLRGVIQACRAMPRSQWQPDNNGTSRVSRPASSHASRDVVKDWA